MVVAGGVKSTSHFGCVFLLLMVVVLDILPSPPPICSPSKMSYSVSLFPRERVKTISSVNDREYGSSVMKEVISTGASNCPCPIVHIAALHSLILQDIGWYCGHYASHGGFVVDESYNI